MDPTMLGFALSVFITIVLALVAGFQWWSQRHSRQARRFSHRVETALLHSAGRAGDEGILKQRVLSDSPELARLLRRLPRIASLDLFLLQSGLDWSVGRLLSLSLFLPLVLLIALSILDAPWLASLAIAFAGATIPVLFVLRKRSVRLTRLEEQLPEAADMIGRALRAGHSLPSALDMAGRELPAPIGAELGLVFNEVNYGVSMNDALAGLSDRIPIDDLRYLVIAILIQRESGGNLAEILDNVGSLIRKRLQLMDKVRVLSAEGRMGGWILTLLPPLVGLIMYQINPGLMSTLWKDPAGIRMLWYGIAMTCFGIVWIRHIVRIHV